jgi:phage protein D
VYCKFHALYFLTSRQIGEDKLRQRMRIVQMKDRKINSTNKSSVRNTRCGAKKERKKGNDRSKKRTREKERKTINVQLTVTTQRTIARSERNE